MQSTLRFWRQNYGIKGGAIHVVNMVYNTLTKLILLLLTLASTCMNVSCCSRSTAFLKLLWTTQRIHHVKVCHFDVSGDGYIIIMFSLISPSPCVLILHTLLEFVISLAVILFTITVRRNRQPVSICYAMIFSSVVCAHWVNVHILLPKYVILRWLLYIWVA